MQRIALEMPAGAFVVIFSLITGQPTVTTRPSVGQKWRKDVQQGQGVYIPCHWLIRCKDDALVMNVLTWMSRYY